MLSNAVSRAYPILSDTVHMPVRGNLSRTPLRIQGPKFVFALRQFQEGPRATGVFRWAWPKTYIGLGILVPYKYIAVDKAWTTFFGRLSESILHSGHGYYCIVDNIFLDSFLNSVSDIIDCTYSKFFG